MIFNIQKCSIHDGEGLRTLVFFKGCPLRCPWCSNPESQAYNSEIMEFPARCVGCGMCMERCPNNAIRSTGNIHRTLCIDKCTECTDICYAEAKRIVGEEYEVEDLLKEIKKDIPFYNIYDGGVTFSGGEPLTHGAYLKRISEECKKNKINVVVESCGFGNFESFKEALPFIDHMFMDIKIIDSARHKEVTGVDNDEILSNIKRISQEGMPITIRTPIVPGYTDSRENIRGIAEFIKQLPTVSEYELMKYHNLGASKYTALGRDYQLKDVKPPSDEEMAELVRLANRILNPYHKKCFYTKDNKKEVITC